MTEPVRVSRRKARHLAMAAYLEEWAGDEQEVTEVLSSHLVEAHRAAPDAPDAADIKARARDALIRAGTRSESLAARRAAASYFEQANELTDEPALKADLLTRAATMSMDAGLLDRGRDLYDRAISITKEGIRIVECNMGAPEERQLSFDF